EIGTRLRVVGIVGERFAVLQRPVHGLVGGDHPRLVLLRPGHRALRAEPGEGSHRVAEVLRRPDGHVGNGSGVAPPVGPPLYQTWPSPRTLRPGSASSILGGPPVREVRGGHVCCGSSSRSSSRPSSCSSWSRSPPRCS